MRPWKRLIKAKGGFRPLITAAIDAFGDKPTTRDRAFATINDDCRRLQLVPEVVTQLRDEQLLTKWQSIGTSSDWTWSGSYPPRW